MPTSPAVSSGLDRVTIGPAVFGPKSALWFVLGVTFLLRVLLAVLIWLNGSQVFTSPDTLSYVRSAQSLLHGTFSVDGIPEVVRTPGYPLLLVPAVASHHLLFVAVLENLLLALISAWLVWKIASDLIPSSKAGWWAALLYCFEPVGFIHSEKLLSEALFATQLLLFVWLALGFLHNPTFIRLAGSAVALGLATYTRPVSLFLSLWLLPFFLLLPRRLSWAARIARAAMFVAVFYITLAPWVIRNIHVASYHGFSAITDVNLYYYSEAAINAKLEHISFSQAQQEMGYGTQEAYFLLHPEQRNWPAAKIFQFQSAEARRTISQHWLLYAMIHLRGCAIVLLDPAATEAMKLLGLYPASGGLIYRATDQGLTHAAFWLIRHYPIVGLAFVLLGGQLIFYYVAGLAGLRYLPLEASGFFIFLFAYFVLVSGSSYAVARFRTPIMPLVCIAAGAAIARWRTKRGQRMLKPAVHPTLP